YLRTVPWLANPGQVLLNREKALLAFRSGLDALDQAERMPVVQAAETVRLFRRILQDLENWVQDPFGPRTLRPASRPAQPVTAIDWFFGGTAHYFIARASEKNPVLGKIRNSWGDLMDFDTPQATAEAHLREATRLDPKKFWPHFVLGRTLLQAKNYSEARQVFTTCVVVRGDFPVGYQMRALATAHQTHTVRLRAVRCAAACPALAAQPRALLSLPPGLLAELRRAESLPGLVSQARDDAGRAMKLALAVNDTAIYWSRGKMFALLGEVGPALDA